jgi:hypothetical protein
MKEFLKRMKQKIHFLCNYVKLNKNVQYTLYGIAGLILIIILLILSFAPLFSSEEFVNYKIKSCYKKHNLNITTTSEINYATVGNMLFMTYEFEQKCYDKIKVEHTLNPNNTLDIIVKTTDIQDDCMCFSKVTAKIGPLDNSKLFVNVYKETDDDKYLVNSNEFEN